MVNLDDLNEWVLNIKQTLFGDANFDFVVDGFDFTIWNASKFTAGTAWCSGDFDANGITDGLDFTVWNANKFQSADNRPLSGLSQVTSDTAALIVDKKVSSPIANMPQVAEVKLPTVGSNTTPTSRVYNLAPLSNSSQLRHRVARDLRGDSSSSLTEHSIRDRIFREMFAGN
jgi:hypothetical protein